MTKCLKCDNPTVEPGVEPGKGGSVTPSQMYCEVHLKELIESGEINPMQIPVPEK